MSNSNDHRLGNLRSLVLSIMESEGRDFGVCEACLRPIQQGLFELHHTKYEGATYYDLEIVCRSCNRLEINVGLA